ncbi:ectonucleotide pyrophosphatase/phosphodiesterase family member 7-like [Phascolarctos cinereus]
MEVHRCLALLLILLSHIACHPLPRKKRSFNKLLVISFDGFRWDYDQDVDTPNMDLLVREGVKAKYLTPPFVTMTSPSHFTTITGRWIEDHGVIHNMMFNTETLWKYSFKDTQKKSEWWDNGVLPLWITAQRQGRKTASFHFPGGGANYSGEAAQRSLLESSTHPNDNETEWRENIDIVMNWFTKENFDFVTLYYGEPDNVGHMIGPETENRRIIIQQIDRTIGYLVKAIEKNGLKDNLNVIITSDHGMTTVKKQPNVTEILLKNYIKFRDLVKFDILDYGGFGMILPKPGKEGDIYNALKNAHPHLKVYKKEEFPEHFHFAKHHRILPILVYGDPGYNINGRFILYINKGDHGYDNADMDMKTIFRAFGPDFKKNHLAEPFDSIHIYPLMCKLLRVTPEPHNGSLTVTQGMLVDTFNQESGGSSDRLPRVTYKLLFIGSASKENTHLQPKLPTKVPTTSPASKFLPQAPSLRPLLQRQRSAPRLLLQDKTVPGGEGGGPPPPSLSRTPTSQTPPPRSIPPPDLFFRRHITPSPASKEVLLLGPASKPNHLSQAPPLNQRPAPKPGSNTVPTYKENVRPTSPASNPNVLIIGPASKANALPQAYFIDSVGAQTLPPKPTTVPSIV